MQYKIYLYKIDIYIHTKATCVHTFQQDFILC